jgi:hypothetical protein
VKKERKCFPELALLRDRRARVKTDVLNMAARDLAGTSGAARWQSCKLTVLTLKINSGACARIGLDAKA